MKHKVGIIGCGGIAEQKHFPALSHANDRVEITAFCDLIPERAESAAKRFGTTGSRVYQDYRALLAQKDIEIVYVLTPNVSHCEISASSFQAGKHVFCEKPMAASLEDAEKMMAEWEKSGKMFTIGYQNRFRPDCRVLKRLCDEEELGKIYYAQAHALRRRGVPTWGVFTDKSKQGGGPLIDIGTHSLDLTLWLMNNYEPAAVTGKTFRELGTTIKPEDQGNFLGTWDPNSFEVEDSAFGFITMKDGSLIILDTSWVLNHTEERCACATLCGTKAGAEMTGVGGGRGGINDKKLYINKIMGGKQAIVDVDTANGMVEYFSGGNDKMEDLECKNWLDALENRSDLIVRPEQAFIVTKILDAIYKSAASGRQILFD
jgi:predicted dehydrogenase